MSCNCNNIDPCSNTAVSCLCGVEFNIYDSSGVLIETVNAYQQVSAPGSPYVINGSTAFEGVLGQSYVLTIQYNALLSRWEMSYYNDTIEEDVVIGVFYGSADSCPASNCWDMDCIAVAFNVLGTYDSFFIWDGTYTNGKKSYTFTSDWSGPDINYSISWGLAPTVAGAPTGTLCWTLTDEDTGNPVGFLFGLNNCPYGAYLTGWGGEDTRFSFTDLGVTGYDVKSSIIDCGCCDEKVSVTTYDGETFNVYELSVNYDEYGNVLVLNGYNYYSYVNGETEYYLYVNSQGNWVLNTLFNNPETELAYTPVSSDCPFGSYNINPAPEPCGCDTILVTYQLIGEEPVTVEVDVATISDGKNAYYILIDGYELEDFLLYWQPLENKWIFYYSIEGVYQATLSEDTPCPFGTYTIERGSIFESFEVSQCSVPTNILVTVKGVDCFDCCDYYRPGNRNLLKKKKAIFVDEISSIRNKEIFGFKCGTSWDDLFRKHLIFDVLNCLPYGVICDEEEQCLINNLNENCNC